MNQAIHFKTSLFDVTKERENPINPIFGLSLLDWLRNEFADELSITDPEAEDWGWYSEIEFKDNFYLIGSCVLIEEDEALAGDIEWVSQIEKKRSIKEKLLGRNKMLPSDPCLTYFKELFEKQPEFKEVQLG